MRLIRRMGLAAVMALALMATLGAGSASAASEITANEYPTTIEGVANSNHYLETQYWDLACYGPSFVGGELAAPESFAFVAPKDTECGQETLGSSTLKMNGCEFIFRFGDKQKDGSFAGTFDIGPAHCGSITWESWCTIKIHPQMGLKATYKNVGSGDKASIEIRAEATGLKYTLSGACGKASGTHEDGVYKGSWSVTGKTDFGATGLHLEPEAEEKNPYPPTFEAEDYSASISGGQDKGGEHAFGWRGIEVYCESVSLAGELAGATKSLVLQPSYGQECEDDTFGINGLVHMNGCSYVLPAGEPVEAGVEYSSSLNISCPQGKVIEVLLYTCTFTIPPQNGLGAVSLSNNLGASPAPTVTADLEISGIEYTLKKFGFCPVSGSNGTYKDGTYTGSTTLSASYKGSPTGLFVWGDE